MRFYRPVSLSFCIIFAVVGLLFLFIPDKVIEFFNTLSDYLNMFPMAVEGFGFYQLLAVGYMYAVTVIAFLMYRHPENLRYPFLLIHCKLATSVLSLVFFLFPGHYLMYLANFIIDGFIGALVLFFYLKMKRNSA
ncbi:MAG: hypothetical protein JW712_01560 [Dehalococcoidales bacterium]|nr:hypothetical protein [Dehalococcoidales bacterium]